MSEERPRASPDPARNGGAPRAGLRVFAWVLGGLAALVLVLALGLVVLDTPPGHAVVARLLERIPLTGGVHIHAKRIEGSIWGRLVLDDVALTDTQGVFLTSPRLVLDWNPSALLHKRIDVHEASADTVRLLRRPSLKPAAPRPNQPTLPNIQIVLSRVRVGSLWLEPAVTGDRRRLGVNGALTIVSGRTQASLDIRAQPVAGQAGGDRLTLRLDAQPARNRLVLDAHLTAPADGVVDRLAGLDRPLTVDVTGQGSWAAWNGSARAVLGGQPLLQASLSARDGRFSAMGVADPALVVKAPEVALIKPELRFELAGSMTGRRLDASIALHSAALDFAAQGGLDLARSRFLNMKMQAHLADPGALASNLSGRDVSMDAVLDGAFRHPAVTYRLRAAVLGLGPRRIEALDASGKAIPDSANGWTAQFRATAAGVSGAGPTLAALGRRLQASGTVRLAPRRVSGQDLQIVSDHLRASVDLDLAFGTGRYAGALRASIRQTPVQGLGVIDATANLAFAPAGPGKVAVSGRLHGRTVRLDNGAAARLLGGPAVLDATLARGPGGAVVLTGLKLTAPKFRILDGKARYAPDGRISASASAVSAAYGPLRLQVSGSLSAPQVTLHADNLGIAGLQGVDLKLNGVGKGAYALTLNGASRYGQVSADVALALRDGSIEADVRSADFAGLRLSGTVRRTPAGPFDGTLRVAGRGLDGTVRLSAAGAVQAADLVLRARNASLPLDPPVTIASGVVRANLKLFPNAPAVTGAADLAGVRRGDLLLSQASLDLTYAAGSGQASVKLAGERGAPFTLALAARLSPAVITVDGGGSVDRIPVRLAAPATVRRTANGYALDRAVLTSRQNRIEISGRYGGGAAAASLRIDRINLGLARVIAPDLGIAGRASGTIDVSLPAGGAAPTARVRLQIDHFSRSTVAEVSEPVDVTLAADLTASGLEAHALLKHAGATIGRAQARLTLAPGDRRPWMDRLRAAPLVAGVRFSGDAETLWSLTGLANQTLSGPLAIGADVSGSLARPHLQGVVRAKALRYENTDYGAVVDHIAIDARFVDTRLQLDALTGRAGDGTVSASGYADLSAASGFPVDLRVRLMDARLANGGDVSATVSGQLAVTNSKAGGALIAGDLTLDQGRYQIVRKGKDEIVELSGVHWAGQPLAEVTPSQAQAAPSGPPSVWKLDVRVHAPQQLYVRGMGLDSEWRTDLRITGDIRHPVVVGDVTLVRGVFSFAGRDLTLSRGVIHLNGASPPDPTLDIEATATVEDVTATIDIGGTAHDPQITFSSDPALPQDEVLARLLFGTSIGQLSPVQAVQLAASLNALRGGGGGLNPLGKLRQVTGFDRLRFYGADKTSGRGPSIGVGRYIAKNLYVELTTDTRGFTATQIELALTNTLRLLSRVGAFGGTQIELRYSRHY